MTDDTRTTLRLTEESVVALFSEDTRSLGTEIRPDDRTRDVEILKLDRETFSLPDDDRPWVAMKARGHHPRSLHMAKIHTRVK